MQGIPVTITKGDALDSSLDAVTGLCDFDLSSSALTLEAIANAINRVRAAVIIEAILGGKSLIMAPIRGSACIAQGHARREWYKKPNGRKYFQQRRSRLSYKDLKIPEVGGRVAEGLRQSNQSEISTQCCHSFASPQIQSFGSKEFRRNVRSGGNIVRLHYAFRLSKYRFLSFLRFSTTGPIYRPLHDENNGYNCKREHRKRKPVRRCIFPVDVPYRSEQNLELRPQQCLGTPPGKGCRQ